MESKPWTVLIVEDDEPKLQAVMQFFAEEFPSFTILTAQSLTTAVAHVGQISIDFAVIDMSIPTYDFAADRAGGGQPQGFGGEDILLFMHSEEMVAHSVILTQFPEFREREGPLKHLLDEKFCGVIYYAGQLGEWRAVLKEVITRLANGT